MDWLSAFIAYIFHKVASHWLDNPAIGIYFDNVPTR